VVAEQVHAGVVKALGVVGLGRGRALGRSRHCSEQGQWHMSKPGNGYVVAGRIGDGPGTDRRGGAMGSERLIRVAGGDLHAETFGDREYPAVLLLADPAGRWPDEYCSRLAWRGLSDAVVVGAR
jgi:hypothetical protein